MDEKELAQAFAMPDPELALLTEHINQDIHKLAMFLNKYLPEGEQKDTAIFNLIMARTHALKSLEKTP